MLNQIPQTAGRIALGVVGVAALAASANTVAILAESVRRASIQLYDNFRGTDHSTTSIDNSWGLRILVPYCSTRDWQSLGIAALKNIVIGTAALWIVNRFSPSLVTNANALLRHIVPIQFTPNHIPLTRLVGR